MKNLKKGMAWMLICVLLMGLFPMNVSSAVDGTAEGITTEMITEALTGKAEVTEAVTEAEMPDEESTTQMEATTEIVTEEESTTEVEEESTTEASASTESTAGITSEGTVSTETVEKTTEVPTEVAGKEETSAAAVAKPFASEEGVAALENEEIQHQLTNKGITVLIDGQEVSANGEGVTVTGQTTIKVIFNFGINNDEHVGINEPCVYKLEVEGISFASEEMPLYASNGDKVGTWKITKDGLLTICYTDDAHVAENSIEGSVELQANVDLADVELDENGDGRFLIESKEYNIHVEPKDRLSEIEIEKRGEGSAKYNPDTGLVEYTFRIKVKALKDTGEIQISDKPGDYIVIESDPFPLGYDNSDRELKDIGGTETSINGKTFWSEFHAAIESMDEGEVVEFTYKAYARPEVYGEANPAEWIPENTNTLTATDCNGRKYIESDCFPNGALGIKKEGISYDPETGKATWEITVSNPNGMDLDGVCVTDKFLNNDSDYYESANPGDMVTVKDDSGMEIEEPLETFLDEGYTFGPDSTAKSYTFIYELEVKEEYKGRIDKITTWNEATISSDEFKLDKSDTGEIGIGDNNPIQSKEGKQVEAGRIEWTVELYVPEGGLDEVVFYDSYVGEGMTLDPDTLVITKDGEGELSDYVIVKDSDSEQFTIDLGNLDEGIYTIKYEMTFDEGTGKNAYHNTAWVVVGTTKGEEVKGTVGFDKILEKTGWANYGSAVQTWTLRVSLENIEASSSYNICDTWSEGFEYVRGSMQATGDRGNGIFDAFLVQELTEENGISFDISGAIAYGATQGWETMSITYQTRYTDIEDFLNSYNQEFEWAQPEYEITNQAAIYEDGAFLDTVSATASSSPTKVLTKEGIYNENTAPFAEYTIHVNQGGNDLLAGADKVTVTDTLPEDFIYSNNSMQILEGASWSITPLPQDLWSVDYNVKTNVLTITIPDDMELTITYKVLVNKKLETPLNSDNATNKVELSGVNLITGNSSYALNGKVVSGRGTSTSTSRSLTVYKYSGNITNLLSGAQFQVKMVDYTENGYVDVDPSKVPGYNGPVVFTTTEDGSYKVTGLIYDHIYMVTETQAPVGYVLSKEERYFAFLHDKEETDFPDEVEFYNLDVGEMYVENEEEESQVFFSKQAVGGTAELPGATIILYDGGGNVVTSWVSGTSAKIFKVGDETIRDAKGNVIQLAAGTYTMRETAAPDGYAYAEDIIFTIDADGKITTTGQNGEVTQNGTKLIMRDKAIDDIYISKKAIGGSDELPGAHIILTERVSGKVIAEWTSGTEAYKLAGSLFKAGTEYVLTETVAPNGYEITEKIIFKIERNGTLSLTVDNANKDAELASYNGSSNNNQIIMRDAASEAKEEQTTEEQTTEEKTTEKKTTEEKTTEEKKTASSKKTGDEIPIVGMALLYGLSVTGLLVLQRKKRLKKQ